MPQPTIIVEIQGGTVQAVYSSTDISFFLIDRDNEEAGGAPISGPFMPTLVREDLVKAFPDDPAVTPELLAQPPRSPYF